VSNEDGYAATMAPLRYLYVPVEREAYAGTIVDGLEIIVDWRLDPKAEIATSYKRKVPPRPRDAK
jgi:hypothetical protein